MTVLASVVEALEYLGRLGLELEPYGKLPGTYTNLLFAGRCGILAVCLGLEGFDLSRKSHLWPNWVHSLFVYRTSPPRLILCRCRSLE